MPGHTAPVESCIFRLPELVERGVGDPIPCEDKSHPLASQLPWKPEVAVDHLHHLLQIYG